VADFGGSAVLGGSNIVDFGGSAVLGDLNIVEQEGSVGIVGLGGAVVEIREEISPEYLNEQSVSEQT
jgi:hypothetical protein